MAKTARSNDSKLYKSKYFIINVKIRRLNSTDDLSANEYVRIFREFYLSGITGRSARQKECVLITQGQQTINEEPVFVGQFAQVTNVNNRKWFDRNSRALDTSFRIPERYAANAAITEYVFIPSIHRFAYRVTAANLIPAYSTKLFLQLALSRHLSTGYVVDVDVESDDATIDRILEAPELLRLEIHINYSNNDFTDDLQKFVEEDMKASNTGQLTIKAVQKPGNSIDVNGSKILSGALEASVSNGDASATIKDGDGKKQVIKTVDNPKKVIIQASSENRISTLINDLKDEFRQQ